MTLSSLFVPVYGLQSAIHRTTKCGSSTCKTGDTTMTSRQNPRYSFYVHWKCGYNYVHMFVCNMWLGELKPIADNLNTTWSKNSGLLYCKRGTMQAMKKADSSGCGQMVQGLSIKSSFSCQPHPVSTVMRKHTIGQLWCITSVVLATILSTIWPFTCISIGI
jgi:hypothetical protein